MRWKFLLCVYNICCLQQCKNCKNPSRFSRVMITNVLPSFLWFTVYIYTNHNIQDNSNWYTVLHSAISTDSVLDAEFAVTLQSSIGSLCVTDMSAAVSHSLSSSAAASTPWRSTWPSSNGLVLLCDFGRRSLLTNSSGKLCRLLRMLSGKWNPSVSACLATTHHNSNPTSSHKIIYTYSVTDLH